MPPDERTNPCGSPPSDRLTPEQRKRAEELVRKAKQDPNGNQNSRKVAQMAAEMLGLKPETPSQAAPARPHPDMRTSVSLEELHSGTTRRITMPNGKTIELTIPKGARDGLTIAVKMAEETFLVAVDQEPHPQFTRKGDDLHSDCYIDPGEPPPENREYAAPTITGRVMLKIPQGTADNTTLRLRGKGMPKPGNPDECGDLYVTVHLRKR